MMVNSAINVDFDQQDASIAVLKQFVGVTGTESNTVQGQQKQYSDVRNGILVRSSYEGSLSVTSIYDQFNRFMSLLEIGLIDGEGDDEANRRRARQFKERASSFLTKAEAAQSRILKFSSIFISDNSCILLHGYCPLVCKVLENASRADRRRIRKVFVTQALPGGSGSRMVSELSSLGVDVECVLDAAATSLAEQVDFVLLGAHCIAKDGAVINKVGTFGIALAARACNKPVYVAVESIKFARLFPLTQRSLHSEILKYTGRQDCGESGEKHNVDLTPSKLITLMFTDEGVMTPSSVCDFIISRFCE